MASEDRDEHKTLRLKESLYVGDAMSCDFPKQKQTETKVCDLLLQYFQELSSNEE